jgi:hypothetical protein
MRDSLGRTQHYNEASVLHTRSAALFLATILLPRSVCAQQVIIHNATPAAVVGQANTQLAPQGFVLEDSSAKSALFVLDRGLVTQGANAPVPVVHIWIELQFRFRLKGSELRVDANEEVVGNRKSRLEFRKPADSDRPNVQRLLDSIRTNLESSTVDTAAKRDSTRP